MIDSEDIHETTKSDRHVGWEDEVLEKMVEEDSDNSELERFKKMIGF